MRIPPIPDIDERLAISNPLIEVISDFYETKLRERERTTKTWRIFAIALGFALTLTLIQEISVGVKLARSSPPAVLSELFRVHPPRVHNFPTG
jgi:hypothetical protein